VKGKAISTDTTEAPMIVFVNDKNKAKAIPIKTGISDNAYVEILSGLQGNEEIIKGNYRAVSKELEDKSAIKIDNKKAGGTAGTGKDASVSVSF
jgi:HlyD family secretion protein